MTGRIFIKKKTFFVDWDTRKEYEVSGAYDINGELRTVFKLINGQEVEAIENEDGTVTVKWQP